MVHSYVDWKFLYPARPSIAITPPLFAFYEQRGWFAQAKMNGKCAVIGLGPVDRHEVYNRHGKPLTWDMPTNVLHTLQNIVFDDRWTVFVGELLHKGNGGPRNTLYLFDVLVWRGEYLIGLSNWDRFSLLQDRCACLSSKPISSIPGSPIATARQITDQVWLANAIAPSTESPGRFMSVFSQIPADSIVEGLVLKNPSAKLQPCFSESSNNDGSVKCRFAQKGYSH